MHKAQLKERAIPAVQANESKGKLQLPAVPALQKASNSNAPAQLKIHVKTGEKFDAPKPTTTAPRLVSILKSPGIYHLQSVNDVTLMKQQADVPVLAPKKHLIGETHSASQFPQVAADWSWAGELLIEAYSQHEKLASPQQEAKIKSSGTKTGNEDIMYAKAKGLEDTAVKGLTNLVNVKLFAPRAMLMAGNVQQPIAFGNLDKVQLKAFCETSWQKCSPALDVVRALQRYITASEKERGLGIFGSYFKGHDSIVATLKPALIKQVEDGIENMADQYLDTAKAILDPALLGDLLTAADTLIPLLQDLIVAYDPDGFTKNQIARMSQDAQANSDIGELDPLREKYMKKNIEAAPVPTLVKIGRQHVTHLQNNLPAKAEAYHDYAAFRDKNTANNVDV